MKEKDNLERIKRIPGKNTKQQNLITRDRIEKEAIYYRNNPDDIPLPIRELFQQHDIDISQSIVLDFQELALLGIDRCYSGIIFTKSLQFITFEIEVSDSEDNIESIGICQT